MEYGKPRLSKHEMDELFTPDDEKPEQTQSQKQYIKFLEAYKTLQDGLGEDTPKLVINCSEISGDSLDDLIGLEKNRTQSIPDGSYIPIGIGEVTEISLYHLPTKEGGLLLRHTYLSQPIGPNKDFYELLLEQVDFPLTIEDEDGTVMKANYD